MVNPPAGREGGIDRVSREQVYDARACPGVAEQLLGPGERAGVIVYSRRQPGRVGQDLADGHVAPAEQRVFDDDAIPAVHPAAGGDAKADGRPASRVLGDKPRDARRQSRQHPPRAAALMGYPLAREHAPPQVEERKHRVLERDMQPERDPTGGVDLYRNVGPADGLRTSRLGGLTHEPGCDQVC
jgi:hypothetical protein